MTHWLGVLAFTGLALAASPGADADVLRLRNGNSIEGKVTRLDDGSFRVKIDVGQEVVIAAADVLNCEAREAPFDELERRLDQIGAADLDALVELGSWAESQGLKTSALRVFERVLAVDPNHEGARDRLGFVLHRNRWVPRKELKKLQLVNFRGAWRTREEVERLRSAEAVAQLDRELADLRHENKFIRENAIQQLVKNDDPLLIDTLLVRLRGDDPLVRMVTARMLGNHAFEVSAAAIYAAALAESRNEAFKAMALVLGSFGRGEFGEWVARDLARAAELPPHSVQTLLALAEAFPHRAVVQPLIDLRASEVWGAAADRALMTLLGAVSRSRDAWQQLWSAAGSSAAPDLGSGWLKSTNPTRKVSGSLTPDLPGRRALDFQPGRLDRQQGQAGGS
ncbi:MAG: hypothetical protein ACKVX7_06100 [Planctomycetota bacterium]